LPQIHPSAFIDEQAQLADDVIIGPHCSVTGAVTIGPGTRLIGHVIINGPAAIGAGNTFYPFTCIGYAPQDRGYNPKEDGAGVLIGDHNVFRESNTVNRATGPLPTTVGSDNYIMACSHVAHDAQVGSRCNFANSALVAGHGRLADQVILAGNTGVAQFCRVGRLAMLSGGEGVTRDLPPYCMVYHTRRVSSVNLIGMRRNGLRDSVRPMTLAFDIYFRQGHTKTAALELIRDDEIIEDPCVAEFVQFIETSEHGITTFGEGVPD